MKFGKGRGVSPASRSSAKPTLTGKLATPLPPSPSIPDREVRRFQWLLFRWYKTYQRDLPWRKTHDPYKILVSEVMLQQTQVPRVIPKYVVFIKRYPTAASFAKAPTADILRLWSGLGYNRRAIYLKRATEIIADEWHNQWPRTIGELQKLPGVGLYTAGAILSFAFNKDVPLADVNMERVIGRIFVGPVWPKLSQKQLLAVIAQVLPKNKSRLFPHAVMDLGAALNANDDFLAIWRKEFPALFIREPKTENRQPKWQGSNRQIRGAVLKSLQGGTKSTQDLSMELSVSLSRLNELVSALASDGLVKKVGQKVALP